MGDLAEYVDDLPNLCGSEPRIQAAIAAGPGGDSSPSSELCSLAAPGSIAAPGSLSIPEPQESPMAEEPAAAPLDAIDLQSLSDEELKRLTQLLMGERERRMGLEPGPEDPE